MPRAEARGSLLTLLYSPFAAALEGPQRVFEVSGSQFPAEFVAFKNLKVVETRYTLFWYIPTKVAMVREIFADRNGEQYRILSLVYSTETSSVGKDGPVFEIVKWNGPYWPGKVIYQLTPNQIHRLVSKGKKIED